MFVSDISKLQNHSDSYVIVKCDSKYTIECENILEKNYSEVLNNMKKNKGLFICNECISKKQNLFDNNYFDKIDNIEKAYLFGLIFNNIKNVVYSKNTCESYLDIKIHDFKYSKNIINLLKYIAYNINYDEDSCELTFIIKSERMLSSFYKHLNITLIKNTHDIDFTYFLENLETYDIKISFIRAYIECNIINESNTIKNLIITSYSVNTLLEIKKIIGIPCEIKKNFNISYLFYNDVNIIDMLGIIYKDNNDLKQPKLYNRYLNYLNNIINLPLCKILKTDDTAIIPNKTRESDVGYDLTIIKEVKRFNSKTVLYDTGIKVYIQPGYYIEVVPRSSISKSGYILSNSIGIIDQSYRGNIMVSLTKIDSDSNDLVLPFKCCQLIIRKQYYANIREVIDVFEETDRNEGGYGSTSK